MRKIIGSLCLVIALLPLSASAQRVNGQKLNEYADSYDRFQSGRASDNDGNISLTLIGYVLAAADAAYGVYACPAPSVTNGQLLAISMKFIRAHPEWWDRSGSALIAVALAEAFPCKK